MMCSPAAKNSRQKHIIEVHANLRSTPLRPGVCFRAPHAFRPGVPAAPYSVRPPHGRFGADLGELRRQRGELDAQGVGRVAPRLAQLLGLLAFALEAGGGALLALAQAFLRLEHVGLQRLDVLARAIAVRSGGRQRPRRRLGPLCTMASRSFTPSRTPNPTKSESCVRRTKSPVVDSAAAALGA